MYLILGIAAGLAVIVVIMYNGLINKKNQVDNAFGGMDAQLKKRYDLIPNLISTVQTYMKHEADTLTQITELRAKAVSGEISDNEKLSNNDIDFIEKEFNNLMFEYGFKSLFHFPNFKEFIKSVTSTIN